MSAAHRPRPLAQRAGLAVASTLASLLLAELLLRALGIAPARYRQPVHLETADKRHGVDLYPDDPRGYFRLDLRDLSLRSALREEGLAEVEARVARTPFAVRGRYSAELCRGGDIPPRRPERARVLVIGDSFTEGQGVHEEDTFVARLAAAMPEAELLNCGRRGYDFPRLREWLELRMTLRPDLVVYAMVLNDPHQSEAFHARQAYLDDWILDRRRMVSEGDGAPPPLSLRLFALLADRLEGARVGAETERWYHGMVGSENAEGWQRTLDDLGRMRDAARAGGAGFLVVLWPLMIGLEANYPFEDTHRTIAAALEARGLAVHDALPAFRGAETASLWVHPADHHPNELGHARFADAIEPAVRAALERRSTR
jgi:lysophospholipase L1-like esterase